MTELAVLLKAPLSPYSGWGQDGIGIASSLIDTGTSLFLRPLEVAPPLPEAVARRLTHSLRPPFDLLLAHVSADRSGLSPVEISECGHRVLWSMWEWTTFANHPGVDDIRRNIEGYDAIVAYDAVSASAFRSLTAEPPPILTVQGGFNAAAWPMMERAWKPPVRFCLVGHLTDRKNPVAALRAFTELLEMHGPSRFNAELHLKIIDRSNVFRTDASTAAGSPATAGSRFDPRSVPEPAWEYVVEGLSRDRVFVHAGTWSRRELLEFYADMHCLLAPSRGEGKNLAALEFMATGGAVIASAFGGHSEWLDDTYAYPLRCALRPASWPVATADAQEADPETGHLQELMWRVYNDLDEAALKGRSAAKAIVANRDWGQVLRRLREALATINIDFPTVSR